MRESKKPHFVPVLYYVFSIALGFLCVSSLRGDSEQKDATEWRSLFDGKTLDQWEGDSKHWKVHEGVIQGGDLNRTTDHNDFLASVDSFGDFELKFKIKVLGTEGFINSGIQVRSQRVENSHEMIGYQVDAGKGWWGKLYDESRRNRVIGEPMDQEALNRVIKEEDWNEYLIRCEGPKIQSWINGVQALDYLEDDISVPLEGKIGFQVHGGGKVQVEVKDISIRPLKIRKGSVFQGAPEPQKKESQPESPLTAEAQRQTFTLPEGFEIELVAQEEPGIGKFVSVAWDQKGRMWSMTALEYPVDANENPTQAAALYQSIAKDKVIFFDKLDGKGPHRPKVFAEGLAIPLGILPWTQPGHEGVYVQHGTEIRFLPDRDGDGVADVDVLKAESVLSGFGIQDSHLFPHQFMRAPGGWIWMSQGAFNSGNVITKKGDKTWFERARMARFRPDGSAFEITSQGPNNVWGLVLNGEGEAFMQEANDYGYAVMPFHFQANYPGLANDIFKTYAPHFPPVAQVRPYRMGGTGLSGLAFSDTKGAWPEAYAEVMYVANPITQRIQAIKIHPDGKGGYRLEKLPDFIRTSDEWFRPVAIHFGPDGCLYIVDWYNRIISHNEVPRNHPDRDKTRGRIWRVKHRDQIPFEMKDLTRESPAHLVSLLGGNSLTQSHLAWQALADRKPQEAVPLLNTIIRDPKEAAARRVAALWALEGMGTLVEDSLIGLFADPNRNVRRESVRVMGDLEVSPEKVEAWVSRLKVLLKDPDFEVRCEAIRSLSKKIRLHGPVVIEALLDAVQPKRLDGAPEEIYQRDFERYLVRLFLEENRDVLASWFEKRKQHQSLSAESMVLASLALEPHQGAVRVAEWATRLERNLTQEEVLRMAEFIDLPGVGNHLKAALESEKTSQGVLEILLNLQSKLDRNKLEPILTSLAQSLFKTQDEKKHDLAIRVVEGFRLEVLHPELAAFCDQTSNADLQLRVLRVLSNLGVGNLDWLKKQSASAQVSLREAAFLALASLKSEEFQSKVIFDVWKDFRDSLKTEILRKMAGHPRGAESIVEAFLGGKLPVEDLSADSMDRIQAVLGEDHAGFQACMAKVSHLFQPVLEFDGSNEAWTSIGEIRLEGAFTVETWIQLEGDISNQDGILASPSKLDINFASGLFRAWLNRQHDVIIAQKSLLPGVWTHVALTRDGEGNISIYLDGELEKVPSKKALEVFENLRIGWTSPGGGGTRGRMKEYRIWNVQRTAEQIRESFERTFPQGSKVESLVFNSNEGWGELQKGVAIRRTSDLPPILSDEQLKTLEQKFVHYRTLAAKPGDAARGKIQAALCFGCHKFGNEGVDLGPNLSGVGAMGVEAILRNLLTPNAAMENAYRIYRVELNSGEVIDAFLVSDQKDFIVVRLPGVPDRRIEAAEIRNRSYLRRSLMPEGILEAMTDEQVSDLFAFLMNQK